MSLNFDNGQVLLCLFSFMASVVVFLVMRSVDRKRNRIGNVKRIYERYQSEIDRSNQSFREESTEIESKIAAKSAEVKNLISTLNEQIKEVSSYSDDMARLRTAMQTFKNALEGLGRLSVDAEQKVEEVTQDAARLEEVRKDIEQFKVDIREAEDALVRHEETVTNLEKNSMAKFEAAISSLELKQQQALELTNSEADRIADEKINFVQSSLETLRKASEDALFSIEDRLDSMKKASDILSDGGKEILEKICERSSEMLLASETVESLARERDKLEKQILELAEQRKVEEDNIAIARAERERLASLIAQANEEIAEKAGESKKVQELPEEVCEGSVNNLQEEIEISEESGTEKSDTVESNTEKPGTEESDMVKKEYYGQEETVSF